jgi:hypothetical protein
MIRTLYGRGETQNVSLLRLRLFLFMHIKQKYVFEAALCSTVLEILMDAAMLVNVRVRVSSSTVRSPVIHIQAYFELIHIIPSCSTIA